MGLVRAKCAWHIIKCTLSRATNTLLGIARVIRVTYIQTKQQKNEHTHTQKYHVPCHINLESISRLTGTRNRRTSAKAYAMRACASAGAANVDISTCRSSNRCVYRGSPLSRSSSSFLRSRTDPRPKTAILHIVSSCRRFIELPLGPSSLPTKLNWCWCGI